MKTILLFVLFALSAISAQDFNKITEDSKTNEPMLIGSCTREAFTDSNFSGWFDEGYKYYKPHFTDEEDFSLKLKHYNIKIIMGSWCSDSRREVPAFYRVLDELHYPTDKVNLIFVDRELQAPNENTKEEHITNVPTIIISENGKEVGRIIESPVKTLEGDLADIVNGKTSETK